MPRYAKAARALERARELPRREDPLDDPAVARLTTSFLELKKTVFRTMVDLGIELGQILVRAREDEEIREKFEGCFQRWQRERLGIDPSTGENYMALARLAARAPGVINTWKELGPAKLYRLARLAAGARNAVLKTPGLQDMIDREFMELTTPLLPRPENVTGNMRAHGLRMRVQGFTHRLAASTVPRAADPRIREGLRRDFLELSRLAREMAGRLS